MLSRKRNWVTVTGMMCAISAPWPALAEDIAPFRLTNIDGEVSVRYFFDEQLSGTTGLPKTGETRTTVEEEVFIRAEGYVYHPNLMKMELGGGPLLVQSNVASAGTSNSSRETLYNFTTRLSFLEKKPYPFSFYYEHLNPSVYTSTTSRFLQENNKVGGTAALRIPGAKVNFSIDAFRASSEGAGIDQVVDDETEQVTFRMDHSFGKNKNGQLLYQLNDQFSRSGSTTATIVPTESNTSSLIYNTKLQFGKPNKISFNNAIAVVDQVFTNAGGTISRKDMRITPDLRWHHNDKTDSFYQLNYIDSEDNGLVTNNRMFLASLSQRPSDRLSRSGDIKFEDNRTTGFAVSAQSIGANAKYVRDISKGQLRFSYDARYDHRDQQATVSQIPVIGEQITLAGTAGVALSHNYVVAATISVSNLSRTQTYIEDVDYRVVVLGARTEIERLASGAILDGQQVLVDYEYETGGSLDYSMVSQSAQASWTLKKYYNVYARANNTSASINSGSSTLPLNTGSNWSVGARADLPLKNDFRVGGEAVYDNYEQNIYPYVRDSVEAYLEMPLPALSNLRLSARQVGIDNIGSTEDVNLRGIMLRLRSRPWFRATLSVEASMEEDNGGSLPRKTTGAAAKLSWRVRRLLLGAEARVSHEAQGTYERDRTLVRFQLMREIL